MAERAAAAWPRLSETLAHPREPGRCQSCGLATSDRVELDAWEEHDEWDRREGIAVLLCRPCGKRLIEPHARLYRLIAFLEPFPGLMEMCAGCRYREGPDCRHPDLRRNGGPGLAITYPATTDVHVRRARPGRSGWEKMYTGPARACAGREATEP